MACNGYNHSPDCNCGWGGINYRSDETHLPEDYWRRDGSYSNPNAKCPVCGQAVFFYRSDSGGAVFFDHPGPPWPKHPCTDSGTNAGAVPPQLSGEHMHLKWMPWYCEESWPIMEGTWLIDFQNRSLWIKGIHLGLQGSNRPYWIAKRDSEAGQYWLSGLIDKKSVTSSFITKAYAPEAIKTPAGRAHFERTFPRSIAVMVEGARRRSQS